MFKMKNEIQEVKHDISPASLRHVTTCLMFMVLSSCSPADLSSVFISIKFICEIWRFVLYWRGGVCRKTSTKRILLKEPLINLAIIVN